MQCEWGFIIVIPLSGYEIPSALIFTTGYLWAQEASSVFAAVEKCASACISMGCVLGGNKSYALTFIATPW